jgi:hypothetical protein
MEACLTIPVDSATTVSPRRARRASRSYHPVLENTLEKRTQQSTVFMDRLSVRLASVQSNETAYTTAICSDGRNLDFTYAIGVEPGLLRAFCDPGSREASFEHWTYAQRFVNHHQRTGRGLDLVPDKPLLHIHFSTAHDSSVEGYGCAAWRGDIRGYQAHMARLSEEINAYGDGRTIALNALLDTDIDGLTLHAPEGTISSVEFALETNDSSPDRMESVRDRIIERLERIYPSHMHPVNLLERRYRRAFYAELADRLVANVLFVEGVRRSNRPPEALDHCEQLIFLGEPPVTTERNEAFAIEDRGNVIGRHGLCHMKIAMQYVVPNCILANPDDWAVPLFIAIPHNGYDEHVIRQYALGYRRRIEAMVGELGAFAAEHGHFPGNVSQEVERAKRHLATELPKRFVVCTTIHHRADRKPVPVDD